MKAARPRWKTIAMAVGAFSALFVVFVLTQDPKQAFTANASAQGTPNAAACSIRKANGQPGDRDCDLVELCKDYECERPGVPPLTRSADQAWVGAQR